MSTPTPKLFPEMRLRAPGAVPPIVLLGEPGALLVLTPACELAICLVPVTSPENGPVLVPSISTIGRPAKPGCVVASMVSASVISGRAEAGVIVCGPEPILKLIVSGPTFRLASIIACLNDPGPLSLVLLTRIGGDCGGEVSVNRLRLQPPVMVPPLPT